MLELWEMQSTHSFSLLAGPLWPEVVAPDRVLSMDQIELSDMQTNDLCWIELFEIEVFDHLTACKQMIDF